MIARGGDIASLVEGVKGIGNNFELMSKRQRRSRNIILELWHTKTLELRGLTEFLGHVMLGQARQGTW